MKSQDVMEFRLTSSELEQVQDYLKRLEEQTAEVAGLVESLEEFSKVEEGSETLFPIANGIFAKGTVTDTETLHVNVGRDVVVPKTVAETKRLVEEQLKSLEEQQAQAMSRQEELYRKLEGLERKVSQEQGG